MAFKREPTFDDFQTHLPYLDAVLRETWACCLACHFLLNAELLIPCP